MYMNSMVNESPTKVFTTAESLTGGAFTAVALGAAGITTAGASSAVIGILTAENELPISAGEDVNVQISGGSLWTVAESISAGDFLSAGEGGKAVKSTSGNFIFAQALDNAAANQAAQVLIIRAGKA